MKVGGGALEGIRLQTHKYCQAHTLEKAPPTPARQMKIESLQSYLATKALMTRLRCQLTLKGNPFSSHAIMLWQIDWQEKARRIWR